MSKKIIYIILLCCIFIMGMAIGFYKLFPLPQLLALKQSLEYTPGTFEPEREVENPDSVTVQNAFLHRLLIKKIPLPKYSRSGGGLASSGNLLYWVSSKGSVETINLTSQKVVNNGITDVPMDISDLVESAHPYKNDFSMAWFRVNGVYSENINDDTQSLYISHNGYNTEKDCLTHNISRTDLNVSASTISQINGWETIFTASPCIDPEPDGVQPGLPAFMGNVSGGIVTGFDKDHLLVTMGDYDWNGVYKSEQWSMKPKNPYGKVIKINKETGDWETFSSGSRNATGLYIAKDSVIWSVENGPEGGDELNILTKNANYGWPQVSYGLWYDYENPLPGNQKRGTHKEYKKPVFSWVPSIAPRGLIKIEGDKFNYWKNDLIVGTMHDQSLHRLRLDESNTVIYNEKIPLGHRVRDLITLPDGKIALITDDRYLILIDDGGPVFEEMKNDEKQRLAALNNFNPFPTDSVQSERDILKNTAQTIYQKNCATCHSLDPVNRIGPHLNQLLDREIGTVDDFRYSQVLKNETRSWNPALLRSFLQNPENEFSGTRMQEINLTDSEIDSLVQFFQN